MEVHESDESQPRRSSIKRPWEDNTSLPGKDNAWHSALLPPIDAVPYRRGSVQQAEDEGPKWHALDPKESVMKRAKFEEHDYNIFPRQSLALSNGKTVPSRNPNSMFTQNPFESQMFTSKPSANGPPNGHLNGTDPAEADAANLCRRCRRLTIQSRERNSVEYPNSCEECKKNPELQWVTQECSTWLTHLADTLISGVSSEQRGIIRGVDQNRPGNTVYPPIESFDLKQTLNWVLDRIYHVNQLADQLVRQVPAASLQNRNRDDSSNGRKTQVGPANIMKRRIDVGSDDAFNSRDEADSSSDNKQHNRQRSVTTSMLDELPPLRSQADYHSSLTSIDDPVPRVSIMNPPPAPNRQLPSPPGRSLPSPTSVTFPSPSTPSFGINTQGVNLPPPTSLHQPTNNSYLPPITAARSPDSALREHTAALQHEVSVQKIALSSLQGEHDKLLAAFSRSQTRASALEKKHAVSDTEIISLTEEKFRLQAQVIELERDVEELGRSRDEFRQAAVQEGIQYVEIVQKASRLEDMGKVERRNWKDVKEDMEQTITALKAGSSSERQPLRHADNALPITRPYGVNTDTPASSAGYLPETKMTVTNELQPVVPTLAPSDPSVQRESVEDLKAEIHRLRERCAEMENALRAIRDDSQSMENTVKTLLERINATLQS